IITPAAKGVGRVSNPSLPGRVGNPSYLILFPAGGATVASVRRRAAVPGRRLFRVEELEGRCLPTTAFGLTTSNGLVTFDSNNPAAVSAVTPITGLTAGDTLEALERGRTAVIAIFP